MNKEFYENFNYKLYEPFGKKIILKEKFNEKRLIWILKNQNKFKKKMRPSLFKSNNSNPFNLAIEYLNNSKNGIFINRYDYFYQNKIGSLNSIYYSSLQNMTREIRNEIIKNMYYYLDIVNSHPTILNYICNKFKIKHRFLNLYVNNREYILNQISKKNKIDRDESKKLILEILKGNDKYYYNLKYKSLYLDNFFKESQYIKNEISKKFKEFYKSVYFLRKITDIEFNLKGEVQFLLLLTIENHILMGICEYFKRNKLLKDTGILLYDGLLIPQNKNIIKLIPECEKFIYSNFGINIKLKIKN